MRNNVIGTAIALLALSSSVFAQSSPSQPNVGGSGTGSVQVGPGGNVGSGSNVGTGSIIGTPPSVGVTGSTSGSATLGSSRCTTMIGSEREQCLLQERASAGATGSSSTTITTPIPGTGTTGAGSTGMGGTTSGSSSSTK